MCRSEEAADVMISEAEYVTVQAKLNEMLCAVCDHAHDRCVKVITARSKVNWLLYLIEMHKCIKFCVYIGHWMHFCLWFNFELIGNKSHLMIIALSVL